MATRVSNPPLRTSAIDAAVETNSAPLGVPPELTRVTQPGIRPSRARAKRIRGEIRSEALIVLTTVSSERRRMAFLPLPPKINVAASSSRHLRSRQPFNRKHVKQRRIDQQEDRSAGQDSKNRGAGQVPGGILVLFGEIDRPVPAVVGDDHRLQRRHNRNQRSGHRQMKQALRRARPRSVRFSAP